MIKGLAILAWLFAEGVAALVQFVCMLCMFYLFMRVIEALITFKLSLFLAMALLEFIAGGLCLHASNGRKYANQKKTALFGGQQSGGQ